MKLSGRSAVRLRTHPRHVDLWPKSSTSRSVWIAPGRAGALQRRRNQTEPLVHRKLPMQQTRTKNPQRHKELFMKNLTLTALIVIATSTGASTLALAQDATAGKASFNKCLACHAIGEGAKNKVGPELNGLDGRKSGTAPDYNYSDANKNSGITWNEAEFKEYIKDPKAKVPGTKMAFAGIKKETEVNDLWAYVSQFDADGKIKTK
jgi:cytochrome c